MVAKNDNDKYKSHVERGYINFLLFIATYGTPDIPSNGVCLRRYLIFKLLKCLVACSVKYKKILKKLPFIACFKGIFFK